MMPSFSLSENISFDENTFEKVSLIMATSMFKKRMVVVKVAKRKKI